jgi:hypothetical protein
MGKHDDSGRGGNDRDDDRGNDDERDRRAGFFGGAWLLVVGP